MKFFDMFSPKKRQMAKWQSDFQHLRRLQRKFAAATRDRLNYNWSISDCGINQDIFNALKTLRMMSRDLSQNNPIGRKFLKMSENNIVGPNGFSLRVAVKSNLSAPASAKDRAEGRAIDNAFYKWARKGVCEVSGHMSFVGLCRAMVRALARDGETLVVKRWGKKYNKFGFALQLIDIDRLDINKNEFAKETGNPIRMGVEYDRDTLRPLVYWILKNHPGDNSNYSYSAGLHDKIPADQVYHLFNLDRPEQLRGYPWMHAVIDTAYHLGEFEKSALIAARIGASTMGMYTSPDGTGDALAGDKDQETGELFDSAEPGVFNVMPQGYTFTKFDPVYPHAIFAPFIKMFQRKFASGTDTAYNTLANDLEGVNFSSIRQGALEERDNWMGLQGFFIESFLEPMFFDWLSTALLAGEIVMPDGQQLAPKDLHKYDAPVWTGRRWPWVDPKSDMAAAAMAIGLRTKSRTQVCSDQGVYFEDVIDEIAQEEGYAASAGVTLQQPAVNGKIQQGDSTDAPDQQEDSPPAPENADE